MASVATGAETSPPSFEQGYQGGRWGSARRYPAPMARRLDISRGATWPVSASASSQYGKGGWHAIQTLGRPDVWPDCADRTGSWAPEKVSSPVEWLEVGFEPGPPAVSLRIFETCNPGAVYAVTADLGEGFELLWLGPPDHEIGLTAQLLDVALPRPAEVRAARVYVDNSQPRWVEIDSVARLSKEAEVPRTIEATGSLLDRHPARARRYTRHEIEAVDSLVGARGVWPVAARVSSEYSAGWDAAQMVGRTKVWPRGGDHRGAWAPRQRKSEREWVELTFPEGTPPARALRVFETCGAGRVVEVRVGAGRELTRVWEGEPEDLSPRRAYVLEVDLPTLMRVERVWCAIDNRAESWCEIDSVSLLTVPFASEEAVLRGDPYRGLAEGSLRDRLMRGEAGAAVGRAGRFSFFEMLSRDWKARWRGTWPSSARASSSPGGGRAVGKAAGSPNLFPLPGALPGSWAPLPSAGEVAWLEVAFPAPTEARLLRIFETAGAGATFAVTVTVSGGESLVWRAPAGQVGATEEGSAALEGGSVALEGGSAVLEIELPEPLLIDRVTAYVHAARRPHIDAIGLLGEASPTEDEEEER